MLIKITVEQLSVCFFVFIIVYVKPTNIVNVTTIKNTKPYFEDRFELC